MGGKAASASGIAIDQTSDRGNRLSILAWIRFGSPTAFALLACAPCSKSSARLQLWDGISIDGGQLGLGKTQAGSR